MKVFFFLIFCLFLTTFTSSNVKAQVDTHCPQIAGEYFRDKCPVSRNSSDVIVSSVIYQKGCNLVGTQSKTYNFDMSERTFGYIDWQPVGYGPLVDTEDTKTIKRIEKYYYESSLFSVTTSMNKAENKVSLVQTNFLQLTRENNLVGSYGPNFYFGRIWINRKNCQL